MAERRRSERITQNITIQLVGMSAASSSAVAQAAQTLSVNDHGALIECRSKLDAGAEIMIHNPSNLLNGLFRVIWAKPSPTGTAWNVAVEFQEISAAGFWGLQ